MMLTTDRLVLRRWRETDAESLFKYASDERVGNAAGWPPHKSIDDSLGTIKNVFSSKNVFAVALKERDEAIGCVSLKTGNSSNFDIPDSEGEIGYWLGVPFWGRGYMPEAVKELVRFAFEEEGLDKLYIGFFDGNKNSERVAEKCGFHFERTNKNVYWPLTDKTLTEHVYSLTKDDYYAIKIY